MPVNRIRVDTAVEKAGKRNRRRVHCWVEVLQQEEGGDDDQHEEQSVVVEDGERRGLVIRHLVLLPQNPVTQIKKNTNKFYPQF